MSTNSFQMYSTAFYQHQIYLQHYGVKGMKWGVRRYQNEDGSYTDAGLKRYAGKHKRGIINDEILLAERKFNKKKQSIKRQLEKGQLRKDQYKQLRKDFRKNFREERSNIVKNAKSMKKNKQYKKLFDRYNKMRDKAMKEIPNYQIKKGARIANKIFTGYTVGGSIVYNASIGALLTSVNPPFGIGYLLGSAAGTAAGGTLGYAVRNKIRRQFT